MAAEDIRTTTLDDEHLGILVELLLHGWPLTKAEVQKELLWSFRGETASIDEIAIKGRRIIVLASLEDRTLKYMHLNHIGIEKT